MTDAAARFAEVRLALMLLTRLPAGRIGEPVPSLSAARWAFPMVGLVVGLCGWLAHGGAVALGLGPALGALAALGAMVLVTGALHLDGLADFADGIGGGRDKAQCLEIMRDSRIGSYGAIALVFWLAVAATSLAQIGDAAALPVFLLLATGSRLAMLCVLDWLPPARGEGLGHGSAGQAAHAWVPGAVIVAVLALWVGPGALVALGAGAGAAGLVAWRAHRRIGGQTGDVLGATQVAAEAAGLVALASALG